MIEIDLAKNLRDNLLWSGKNVVDKYKHLSDEEIKNKLAEQAFPFSVCFENWIGDFNLSTGIRNANAFGAREVFYVGNKKRDMRGAVGCQNYIKITHYESFDKLLENNYYELVGVDNVSGAISINECQWNHNTMFIFGEEGCGLTETAKSVCSKLVYIEQFGSVRSLNCGTASGIIMNDFVTKIRRKSKCLD